ncbi:putative F-box/FBD/LRR-repeat protein [Vigna angularis]|uniref:Putative F-box/FBD/LRR-repeat protein n=1 Tax=Phaseolus angularis TaxID=3914 RepID=A0A8T0KCX7_PHAAN|nr:putative F-box/FBD/LRR-repeat protein [Vigna angularis]
MDFITQVFSIRDKHSDIRVLCFRARLSFSRLNGLIRRAIRHNVRELDIEASTVCTDDYFNFPRCVIGSESLRVLKLRSGFRLPPSSVMRHGFQSLKTLSLSFVILNNQPSLTDLFSESSFPLLQTLHLDACFGLKYLRVGCRALVDLNLEKCNELEGLDVSCAKLERMRLVECFVAYSEKSWVKINAPMLEHLCWQHNAVTDMAMFEPWNLLHEVTLGFFILTRENSQSQLQSAVELLSGLSRVHSLSLERETIEILSNNHLLFQPFYDLKHLELQTGFNKSNVPGLTCLFKSSPTLNTLILKIIHEYKIERKEWNRDLWDMTITEGEQYWESQIRTLESFLQHLKVVKIHGFLDYENEVALAKFLLKHGKSLEEMQTDVVPLVQSAKKPAQPKESKPKPKDEPKKVAKPEPGKPKEEAEEEAPKPKPKNPLDLLPPSKMILDEWKRLYSNTKTNFREVAIKGFWDMYDPEADGSGSQIPQFVIDECYDMEMYEWTKVDISDKTQKDRSLRAYDFVASFGKIARLNGDNTLYLSTPIDKEVGSIILGANVMIEIAGLADIKSSLNLHTTPTHSLSFLYNLNPHGPLSTPPQLPCFSSSSSSPSYSFSLSTTPQSHSLVTQLLQRLKFKKLEMMVLKEDLGPHRQVD